MPTNKNTTLSLHSALAHEIKAAKKKMFRNHREGMPLREAADKFVIDVTNRFGAALLRETDTTEALEPAVSKQVQIDPSVWVKRLTEVGDPEIYDALFNLLTYTVAVTAHDDPQQKAILDGAITESWLNSESAYDLRQKQAENMERAVKGDRCQGVE